MYSINVQRILSKLPIHQCKLTVYDFWYTTYDVESTLHIVHCSLYGVQYTLHIHFILYTVQRTNNTCTLLYVHYMPYAVHQTMYSVQLTYRTSYDEHAQYIHVIDCYTYRQTPTPTKHDTLLRFIIVWPLTSSAVWILHVLYNVILRNARYVIQFKDACFLVLSQITITPFYIFCLSLTIKKYFLKTLIFYKTHKFKICNINKFYIFL